MDLLNQIRIYLGLQTSILNEIKSVLREDSEAELEEKLWEFNQVLESGWVVIPHGEHLTCIKPPKYISLEIPLYTPNQIGIDAGHFNQYITSIGKTGVGYKEMTEALEQLENNKVLAKVTETPPVWQLNEQ